MKLKILDREVELVFVYDCLEKLGAFYNTDLLSDVYIKLSKINLNKPMSFTGIEGVAAVINSALAEPFPIQELKGWVSQNWITNVRIEKVEDEDVTLFDPGVVYDIMISFYASINTGNTDKKKVTKKSASKKSGSPVTKSD